MSDRPDEASRAAAGAREREAITGRAGIVAAGTLVSRVLGLGRDQVLAAVFSKAATDVFFVAFVIPNVLRQLLAEGATQSGVIPVLAKTREEQGDGAARETFRALRGVSLLVLLAVTVAGVVFAPHLVDLFAGGYRQHGDQWDRTVALTRWVFPYIFFMGTAALGVAALNTHHRFVATSFSPALLNVSFIVFALALPGWFVARGEDPVLALAVATLVGGALQVVAQWPSLRAIGYLQLPTLSLRHPGVAEVMRRMGPVLFGTGVYFVDVVVARRFLSDLDVGSQSYFGWALRLCDFPQGILVMALQTAALPSLAALAARGERDELARTFAYGLRLATFVGIAATGLFVALAEPLVVAIFQRGEFDAVSSRETARALAAQGAAIWMVAAVRQLVTTFYAMGDTRTPVVIAAVDFGVFLALALALRGPLGHVGISLAVTGAAAAQMTLLWLALTRKLPTRSTEVFGSLARAGVAAASAGIAAAWTARRAAEVVGDGSIARLVPGAAGVVVFAVAFTAVAWAVRSPEPRELLAALRSRATRRAAAAAGAAEPRA